MNTSEHFIVSVQINMRAGQQSKPEFNGKHYLKTPIGLLQDFNT